MKTVVLGAGLSGLSCAYHLKDKNLTIFEKNEYVGGHIFSEKKNEFVWDEGPHVSFTKNEYVIDFFKINCNSEILDYPVNIANYYNGNWIPHPAQTNMYAIPELIRQKCLEDFMEMRENLQDNLIPKNYAEWLECSFGKTFAETFPTSYTTKYWTTHPKNLTVDWVGERVLRPEIESVKKGFFAKSNENVNYIKSVRYPSSGGFYSFIGKLIPDINVSTNHEIKSIDFEKRMLVFKNGNVSAYERLISTIPLPTLIECSNAPDDIKLEAKKLNCTSILLVNITANHTTQRTENWIYVYDNEKYSTRINCTELLSPNNAPEGMTGIQVEVYFSKYKPLDNTIESIALSVSKELIEMGLIKSEYYIDSINTKIIKWANVVYDHDRVEAQNKIFNWLSNYGLVRENDDLAPMTDWNLKMKDKIEFGNIILAGRFAQWKYYWTDDCILRSLLIGTNYE